MPAACVWCARPAEKRCARCKRVRYCTVACQRAHWKGGHHSVDCALLQKGEGETAHANQVWGDGSTWTVAVSPQLDALAAPVLAGPPPLAPTHELPRAQAAAEARHTPGPHAAIRMGPTGRGVYAVRRIGCGAVVFGEAPLAVHAQQQLDDGDDGKKAEEDGGGGGGGGHRGSSGCCDRCARPFLGLAVEMPRAEVAAALASLAADGPSASAIFPADSREAEWVHETPDWVTGWPDTKPPARRALVPVHCPQCTTAAFCDDECLVRGYREHHHRLCPRDDAARIDAHAAFTAAARAHGTGPAHAWTAAKVLARCAVAPALWDALRLLHIPPHVAITAAVEASVAGEVAALQVLLPSLGLDTARYTHVLHAINDNAYHVGVQPYVVAPAAAKFSAELRAVFEDMAAVAAASTYGGVGLYTASSMINHAHGAAANVRPQHVGGAFLTFVALRDVDVGEEILVDYTYTGGNTTQPLGFDCACAVCVQKPK